MSNSKFEKIIITKLINKSNLSDNWHGLQLRRSFLRTSNLLAYYTIPTCYFFYSIKQDMFDLSSHIIAWSLEFNHDSWLAYLFSILIGQHSSKI